MPHSLKENEESEGQKKRGGKQNNEEFKNTTAIASYSETMTHI